MYFSNSNVLKILTSDPKLFKSYYLTWGRRVAMMKMTGNKPRPEKYAGKIVKSLDEGNELLRNLIESNKPFMAGRFGSNELMFTRLAYFARKGYQKKIDLESVRISCGNCGLFPLAEETIFNFGEIMIDAVSECDVMAVWYNILEDYFVEKYMDKTGELTHRKVLDFWNFDAPWTEALAGKKVLVIHPLAELIEEQYKKRTQLFRGTNYLPSFELKTLKAIQTIAGTTDDRCSTWEEGLRYMHEESRKIDFDIAIIGCGAYGYPLAAYIKRDGKQAIHMGGVTQILFGINGVRWERDGEPLLVRYFNESWIKPEQKYIPKNADQVEGGCYW